MVDILVCRAEKSDISTCIYILEFIGTVSVALTMLVTLFFLAPSMGLGVIFADSNLFLHVICLISSVLVFVLFEKNADINFKFDGMSSEYVARYTLSHLNEFYIVPGFFIMISRALINFLPEPIVSKIIYNM